MSRDTSRDGRGSTGSGTPVPHLSTGDDTRDQTLCGGFYPKPVSKICTCPTDLGRVRDSRLRTRPLYEFRSPTPSSCKKTPTRPSLLSCGSRAGPVVPGVSCRPYESSRTNRRWTVSTQKVRKVVSRVKVFRAPGPTRDPPVPRRVSKSFVVRVLPHGSRLEVQEVGGVHWGPKLLFLPLDDHSPGRHKALMTLFGLL